MPSKFAKVQKHITKKKGPGKIGSLNENSRDAKRLGNAAIRDDRVQRMTAVRSKANGAHLYRISFFQGLLLEAGAVLTDAEVHGQIQQYLDRDLDILEELRAERRAGRPKSTKQTLMEQTQNAEAKEYETGFWMPDLQNTVNVEALREWNGMWTALAKVKFVRVDKSGSVKESAWPPKGAA